MLNIQLFAYLVTVLDNTTMLVTIFLVCLCSRHNKGRFWSVPIWCPAKSDAMDTVVDSCRMYLCVYNMDRDTVGSCKAVHVNGVKVHDDGR